MTGRRVGSKVPLCSVTFAVCGACLALLSAACAVLAKPPQSARELIDVIASPTSSHEDRWKAVQALKSCGGAATPGLLRILSRAGAKGSRYYAIRALGYLNDPRATEALSAVLLDRGYGPRRYAAIALGQIGDPKAVSALTEALTDVPHVRADALDALVKIDSRESREALENYHFWGSEPGLRLQVSCQGSGIDIPAPASRTAPRGQSKTRSPWVTCEPSSVSVGDKFAIKAALANTSERTVRVAVVDGEPMAYLVFQRADGGFVESVATGIREDREERGPSVRELKPGATLDWRFAGIAQEWTRGEKDDNTFIPSVKPFLTLSFDATSFHIRRPGEFRARVVLRQDEESKTIAKGRPGGGNLTPLRVVSNVAALRVRAAGDH